MHYRLIQVERKNLCEIIYFQFLFYSLEALNTPAHLINPSDLSPEKYAGNLKKKVLSGI